MWKIQELSEPSEARQEAQWPEGPVLQKCYDSRICVMQQGEGSEAGLSLRSITRDRKASHWVPVSTGVYPGKKREPDTTVHSHPPESLPECSKKPLYRITLINKVQ